MVQHRAAPKHQEYIMIIVLDYAKRLIKAGKATIVSTVTDNGAEYYVINRHDIQRTDHACIIG